MADVVAELHKQIKQLEASKKASAESMQRTITLQRAEIDKFKRENAQMRGGLVEDSKCVMSGPYPPQQDRKDKLYELVDTYTRKIDIERRQLESLEKELELQQAKVMETRRSVGGHSGLKESQVQPAKHLKALETRLDQAEKKFNENIAKNKELRQEIDSLSKSRSQLEKVQARLEKEISGKASEIASLQEAAKVARDANAEATAQVAALKVASDKEAVAYDAEIKALAKAAEADQNLLQAQARRLNRVLEAVETHEAGQVLVEDARGPSLASIVQQLQQLCGVQGYEELVTRLSGLEAKNFGLFNSCNEANDRISALQKHIRSLETEIRQLEVDSVIGKQKEVIRQTLSKRDAAMKRSETFRDKQVALERRMALIRAGVTATLKTLGVAASTAASAGAGGARRGSSTMGGEPAVAATGRDESALAVAWQPLLQGLGQLEVRARAILAVYNTAMGKSTPAPLSASMNMPSIGRTMSAASAAAKVMSNDGEDDEDGSDDDADVLPLTREEIQAQTVHSFNNNFRMG